MKKLISIALAIMLIMSLATVAFAASDGKITITNSVSPQEYTIYKMLDLKSFSGDKYTYTVATGWTDFFAKTEVKAYMKEESTGYVTWVGEDNDTRKAEFVQLALAYVEEKGITGAEKTGNNGALEFAGLDLGYYLVDSTMGTLCNLTTTDKEVVIQEKNIVPDVSKEVQDDETADPDDEWGENNTAGVGEVVNFKITFNPGAGKTDLVIYDNMDEGLTLNAGSISVNAAGLTAGTDYQIATSDHGFTITFENESLAKLPASMTITYSATVNEKAVTRDPETNTVKVSYKNDPGSTENFYTEEDSTKTYTYEFDLIKIDGSSKKPLAGAEFKLTYENSIDGAAIDLFFVGNVDGIPVYRPWVSGQDAVDAKVTVIKPEKGFVRIVGLDLGTYYLVETKAPDGYNGLTTPAPVEIEIVGDYGSANRLWDSVDVTTDPDNPTYDNKSNGAKVIENNTGSQLPETGAMGTAMFVSFGTLVVLGTGVLLVTKKRMSMIED